MTRTSTTNSEEGGTDTPQLFNSPELERPIGFSHAATAQGETYWFSGQISADENGGILYQGDMAMQFGQALRNLAAELRAAKCEPINVVKLTYFVTDIIAYKNAAHAIGPYYVEVFGHHFPPATLVEVKGFIEPEAMVEIECVAVRRG